MRTRTTTGVGKKLTTALLTLAMVLGVVLLVPAVALADSIAENSKTVACLGTSGIEVADSGWSIESGSYVYYGRYDEENPARFRMLANGTTAFSEGADKTMLLDCDMALFTGVQWDSSGMSNKWKGSTAYGKVNEFLQNNLTAQEQAAVRASSTEVGITPLHRLPPRQTSGSTMMWPSS